MKIYCCFGENKLVGRAVVDELEALDAKWGYRGYLSDAGIISFKDEFVFITPNDKDTMARNGYTELGIIEFIEAVKQYLQKKKFTVELTPGYVAHFTKGDSFVKVNTIGNGEIYIPVENIKKLKEILP